MDKAVFKPEKKEFFTSSLAIVQQLKKWDNWGWITHPLNYKVISLVGAD